MAQKLYTYIAFGEYNKYIHILLEFKQNTLCLRGRLKVDATIGLKLIKAHITELWFDKGEKKEKGLRFKQEKKVDGIQKGFYDVFVRI